MRIPVMSANVSLYKSEMPYRSNGVFMVSGGITPQWDCVSRCLDECGPHPYCPRVCRNICTAVQYVHGHEDVYHTVQSVTSL
jgi:hypothetical protein